MHITKVKVCGVFNLKSLKLCLKNKVDGIGFVIYKKSSRYISVKKTKKLIKHIPVFIHKFIIVKNPKKKILKNIFKKIKFDFLQFYGNRNKNLAKELCKKTKINFLRVYNDKEIIKKKDIKYNFISIEKKENLGKGIKINLNKKLKNKIKKIKTNKMISGGLNNSNIYYIIRKFKPDFVDISSGMEYKKKKNKKIIKMVIKEIHLANFKNVF